VADIVDRARPRPLYRCQQHIRQILDVDARENLARPVDAFCGAGAQRVEQAAARAVDAGEAEDVYRHAVPLPQIEPALLGDDAAPAALAARVQFRILVHPATAAVAINAGGGEIAEPLEAGPVHETGNVVAMGAEHRIAG